MTVLDVIGLGYAAVDYIGVVPHLPESDTKLPLESLVRQGGGPAATATVAAARLGARTAFMGSIGDDDLGEFILRAFDGEGVDTSHIVAFEGAASQFAFIMVESGSGNRTILWTRSDLPTLDPTKLDREFIQSCKVLQLDRHQLPACLQAARWVREAGGIVALDAGTYAPEAEELTPLVDVLIASYNYAVEATGEVDPAQAARALSRGRRIAGVTWGGTGSWFVTSDGDEFHQPAFEVEVVDTTGAGDVFHGAFAFGLSREWDARRCARFASAVAALKCTKLGGRAGIPSYEEAEALAHEQGE